VVAYHHAQRENEEDNADDPHEADEADQVAALGDKVAARVRVGGPLGLEITCTYLAGKVKSENVQDKDSTETEYIIDHKGLVESGEGCRLSAHGYDHNERAENVYNCN
jgi:phosphoribosylanthranilate isomerase